MDNILISKKTFPGIFKCCCEIFNDYNVPVVIERHPFYRVINKYSRNPNICSYVSSHAYKTTLEDSANLKFKSCLRECISKMIKDDNIKVFIFYEVSFGVPENSKDVAIRIRGNGFGDEVKDTLFEVYNYMLNQNNIQKVDSKILSFLNQFPDKYQKEMFQYWNDTILAKWKRFILER